MKFWTEEDYSAWDKAGRPTVPPALRLKFPERSVRPPLVTPAPRHTLTTGSWLTPDAKQTRREAKSKAVDQLLGEMGIK
jgi:hypothetical protein